MTALLYTLEGFKCLGGYIKFIISVHTSGFFFSQEDFVGNALFSTHIDLIFNSVPPLSLDLLSIELIY